MTATMKVKPEQLLTDLRWMMAGVPLMLAVTGEHSYGIATPEANVEVYAVFCAGLRDKLSLFPERSEVTFKMTAPSGIATKYTLSEFSDFCRGIAVSHPDTLEALYSPLCALETDDVRELRVLAKPFLRVKPLAKHYQHRAHEQWLAWGKDIPTPELVCDTFRFALTGCHCMVKGEMEVDLERLLEWWLGGHTQAINSSLYGFLMMARAGVGDYITNPERLSLADSLFSCLMEEYRDREKKYLDIPTGGQVEALNTFAVERALKEE